VGNTQTSSTTDDAHKDDVCPICDGMGFVTRAVPVSHPDFGKAFPCVCQRERIAARRSEHLRALSNLDALADKTFESFELDLPGLSSNQLQSLRTAYSLALGY